MFWSRWWEKWLYANEYNTRGKGLSDIKVKKKNSTNIDVETQRVKTFLPVGESATASQERWPLILAFESRQKWKRKVGGGMLVEESWRIKTRGRKRKGTEEQAREREEDKRGVDKAPERATDSWGRSLLPDVHRITSCRKNAPKKNGHLGLETLVPKDCLPVAGGRWGRLPGCGNKKQTNTKNKRIKLFSYWSHYHFGLYTLQKAITAFPNR